MHKGRLFESTGGEGTSSLREVDRQDGRVLRSRAVEGHFAEGLCLHKGSLYQLTWKSGLVFRYEPDTFDLTAEYQIQHEGWGLAACNGELWVSDGSSRIRRYSERMQLLDVRSVARFGVPLRRLNALCVANGRVLANIWYSSWIGEFEPRSGRLTRMIDCREVVALESPRSEHHILNGIAVDEDSGTLYLTGKHWRRCFEVQIPHWS